MPRAQFVDRVCSCRGCSGHPGRACGNVKTVPIAAYEKAKHPILCAKCSRVQRSKVRGVFRLSPRKSERYVL